jgi:TRAP-type C4-dicarboxylate transport system permease small subunit
MQPSGANDGDDPASSSVRQMVKRLLKMVDVVARIDGWLGALCLFLLCSLMIAGIIVRTFSNVITWLPRDIPVAWEYSSYLMAVTFAFGAALTLRAGGHIRVRILLSNGSPIVVRILELIVTMISLAFAIFFSVAMGRFAWRAYILDERSLASNTPLWIPESLVAFGVVLLTLQLFARLGQLLINEPPEDKSIIY